MAITARIENQYQVVFGIRTKRGHVVDYCREVVKAYNDSEARKKARRLLFGHPNYDLVIRRVERW